MSEISSLTHAISVDPHSGERIGHYPSTPTPHWKRRCNAPRKALASGARCRWVSAASTCSPWQMPCKPIMKPSPT